MLQLFPSSMQTTLDWQVFSLELLRDGQKKKRLRGRLKFNPTPTQNPDRGKFYCFLSFSFLSISASLASAIITTSLTVVGLLVAFRTVFSLHPHSRHSYLGGVNPI